MRRVLSALPLTALLLTAPVLAPAAQAQVIMPTMDQVTVQLTQEDWVRTETARVTLVVDAVGNGGSVRDEVLKAAAGVSDRAEWRIVSFDRRQDEAGLDKWQAVLETRLPEASLGGLEERARKASRAGLQMRVAGVDFTPTVAEIEAARSRLRAQIYARVTEELKSVNAQFPGRAFRVAQVNFEAHPASVPPPHYAKAERMAMAAAPMENGAAPAMDVAQKITLTAHVSFQAVAPNEPGK
ncbi:MAG TPA: hypothetical protein VED40_03300 [Azospirillaceae bacterium]|nr:hypothetical protein [Azospirillaceae bacterium]